MAISIIIPTYEREALLRDTLGHALNAANQEEAEIIVVNDSEKPLQIDPSSDRVRLIRNRGKGVASARNTGAAEARHSVLWFLDDDIWISREAFLEGMKVIQDFPDSAFNFNWVYPPDLLKEVRGTGFGRFLVHIQYTTMEGWCRSENWKDHALFPAESLAGATLLLSAKCYNVVGGYDSSFPLAGAEDFDFSERLRHRGVPMFIDSRVTLFHNERHKSNLEGFLKRSRENAITRKHAFKLGYKSQEVVLLPWKKAIYRILIYFEPLLIRLSKAIAPYRQMEFISFRLFHLLVGLNIYKGYFKLA